MLYVIFGASLCLEIQESRGMKIGILNTGLQRFTATDNIWQCVAYHLLPHLPTQPQPVCKILKIYFDTCFSGFACNTRQCSFSLNNLSSAP